MKRRWCIVITGRGLFAAMLLCAASHLIDKYLPIQFWYWGAFAQTLIILTPIALIVFGEVEIKRVEMP